MISNIRKYLYTSKTLYNIGGIYRIIGNYIIALECYQKALKIAENLGDDKYISVISNGIGNLYSDMDNYEKAIEYYHESK